LTELEQEQIQGGVYDVSSHNDDAVFESLSALLGSANLSTLIPSSVRHGGMSIRFMQGSVPNSDNKYVQYRLTANSWSTNIANWQGVDDTPTPGSENLVKSGGVETYTNENFARQKHSESDTDLDLTDDFDNILVHFKDGHIKTKNFNSQNIYTKEEVNFEINSEVNEAIANHPYSENGEADLDITDENGNIIGRYKDGVHLTKYPSPYTKDNNEVFDVEDAAGNKVFRIKNGYPITKNYDGSKVSPMVFNQVRSSIGEGQMRTSYATIASNAVIHLTDFPRYIDTRKFVSFIGYIDSFPSNTYFDFGFRYKYNNQYWHSGGWIRVTSTSVEIYHDSNENVSTLEQSYTHGLALTTFVKVFMYLREDYNLYIIIETLDGKYVIEHNRDNVEDKEIAGHPTFINSGITFTNAQITAGSADFKSPIWIFGDSYSTASYGYSRIGGQLMDLGLTQNTCYDHLGGNNHQDAWDDLQLMLQFGTPRMIVWLLGVNGSQPNNVTITGMLKDFCDNNGIELILEYPPLYPNSVGIDTTALRNAVLATECRIVDFSRAVGCHIENNDAVWYDGYLQSDKIHPTEKGSRALVMQIINDIPEILQWGVNEHPVYYSENNN
jgi:hypothetical protein